MLFLSGGFVSFFLDFIVLVRPSSPLSLSYLDLVAVHCNFFVVLSFLLLIWFFLFFVLILPPVLVLFSFFLRYFPTSSHFFSFIFSKQLAFICLLSVYSVISPTHIFFSLGYRLHQRFLVHFPIVFLFVQA